MARSAASQVALGQKEPEHRVAARCEHRLEQPPVLSHVIDDQRNRTAILRGTARMGPQQSSPRSSAVLRGHGRLLVATESFTYR